MKQKGTALTITITVTEPRFGQGVYALSDVSRLIKRPYSTVRSWFHTRNVLASDYPVIDGEFGVSFYDLMDAKVGLEFRKCGVSLRMIRRAYSTLAVKLGVDHPFCHRELYTDGERVLINTAAHIGSPRLQDAVNNQRWFTEFTGILAKVSYSNLTKLALRWHIASGVVVDPEIAMGSPVIEKTGVTTYIINRAFLANHGNVDLVANMYGLEPSQVRHAVQFEKSLKAA